MSERKKSGKVDNATSRINLTAALINLVVALILLYEKLSS